MIARFSRDGRVTARRWLLAQVRHVGWKDTLEAWPFISFFANRPANVNHCLDV
jgi:hypothetical protein